MVVLVSQEGTRFEIDADVARRFVMISTMLDNVSETTAIPVANVSAPILAKLVEFATHYKDEPLLVQKDYENGLPDDPTNWDLKFIDVDLPTQLEILKAANYFDIQHLLALAGYALAQHIKGKTADQIRHTFGIKNNFTPEEEEVVKRENRWCEP